MPTVLVAILLCCSVLSWAKEPVLTSEPVYLLGKKIELDSSTGSQNAMQAKILRQPGLHTALAQFRRPLSVQDRVKLTQAGIGFLWYVPVNAYMIQAEAEALQALSTHSLVKIVTGIPAGGKIDPALLLETTESLIECKIVFVPGTSFETALDVLSRHGTELNSVSVRFDFRETLNRVKISSSQLLALAEEECVQILAEVDPPDVPANYEAQKASHVNEIHDEKVAGYVLDGSGVVVGVWDTPGVRVNHEQIQGRVSVEDYRQEPEYHVNHVVGTIAASGANRPDAQGMAPAAKVLAWDMGNDLWEVERNVDRISVSNHSYVASVGEGHGNPLVNPQQSYWYGIYSSKSWSWEQIVYEKNHTLVTSSGNERRYITSSTGVPYELNDGPETSTVPRQADGVNKSGYDTITPLGSCKNVITVGAILKMSAYPPVLKEISMASFSSWGPTDDGRIKPDLVAVGSGLLSLDSASDDAYAQHSGTSMSSPVVTGAVACLVQQFRNHFSGASPTPDIIKSILLHTAEDGQTVPGPDYRFGWGLLNARAAADFIKNHPSPFSRLLTGVVADASAEYIASSTGVHPIKLTLVWTDPPGYPLQGTLNNRLSNLVNDLDLEVIGPDGIHYPWTLDPDNPKEPAIQDQANHRDNIEQVYIATPVAGQYRIRIKGQINLGYGQNYSLCASGLIFPNKEPEIILFSPFASRRIRSDETIKIYASSDALIDNIEVLIDGKSIGSSNSGPVRYRHKETYYTLPLKISSLVNGLHTLKVELREGDGQIHSRAVYILVFGEDNTGELIVDGEPVLGDISFDIGKALYSFAINQDGYYSVLVQPVEVNTATVDPQVTLLGPEKSNKTILADDDSGPGASALTTAYLEKGNRYFAQVSSYAGTTGIYKIQVMSATAPAAPVIEEVTVNSPGIPGYFSEFGEVKWYSFKTATLGHYVVRITPESEPAANDILITLYNPDNLEKPLSTGTNYIDYSDLTKVLAEGKTLYIRLLSQKSYGHYSLSILAESETLPVTVDIRGQGILRHHKLGGVQSDWYKVPVTEAGYYVLELENYLESLTQHFIVELYDLTGVTEIVRRGDYKNRRAVSWLFPLPLKDGYYIKVTYFNAEGSYFLRIRKVESNSPVVMTRSFSSIGYEPGKPLTVSLAPLVITDSRISRVNLFETPPPGWTLADERQEQDFRRNGFFLLATLPNVPVSYDIIPPSDATDCYSFSVQGSFVRTSGSAKTAFGKYVTDICSGAAAATIPPQPPLIQALSTEVEQWAVFDR